MHLLKKNCNLIFPTCCKSAKALLFKKFRNAIDRTIKSRFLLLLLKITPKPVKIYYEINSCLVYLELEMDEVAIHVPKKTASEFFLI